MEYYISVVILIVSLTTICHVQPYAINQSNLGVLPSKSGSILAKREVNFHQGLNQVTQPTRTGQNYVGCEKEPCSDQIKLHVKSRRTAARSHRSRLAALAAHGARREKKLNKEHGGKSRLAHSLNLEDDDVVYNDDNSIKVKGISIVFSDESDVNSGEDVDDGEEDDFAAIPDYSDEDDEASDDDTDEDYDEFDDEDGDEDVSEFVGDDRPSLKARREIHEQPAVRKVQESHGDSDEYMDAGEEYDYSDVQTVRII